MENKVSVENLLKLHSHMEQNKKFDEYGEILKKTNFNESKLKSLLEVVLFLKQGNK